MARSQTVRTLRPPSCVLSTNQRAEFMEIDLDGEVGAFFYSTVAGNVLMFLHFAIQREPIMRQRPQHGCESSGVIRDLQAGREFAVCQRICSDVHIIQVATMDFSAVHDHNTLSVLISTREEMGRIHAFDDSTFGLICALQSVHIRKFACATIPYLA